MNLKSKSVCQSILQSERVTLRCRVVIIRMKLLVPLYNKFTNIRQHNKYLLENISYIFRPVNRSISGLQ